MGMAGTNSQINGFQNNGFRGGGHSDGSPTPGGGSQVGGGSKPQGGQNPGGSSSTGRNARNLNYGDNSMVATDNNGNATPTSITAIPQHLGSPPTSCPPKSQA